MSVSNYPYLHDDLINKKLRSVSLNADKTIFTMTLDDGTEVRFEAVGDCCSRSWVEHLETPGDVAGATILGIENVFNKEEVSADYDYLKFYEMRIHTNHGAIVLEFRNSSNGYYGGWMERKR